nr:hypothetical protein CFP56_56838 [Quercus suber]
MFQHHGFVGSDGEIGGTRVVFFLWWLGAVSWVFKGWDCWVCGFFWVSVVIGVSRRRSGIFGQGYGGRRWSWVLHLSFWKIILAVGVFVREGGGAVVEDGMIPSAGTTFNQDHNTGPKVSKAVFSYFDRNNAISTSSNNHGNESVSSSHELKLNEDN